SALRVADWKEDALAEEVVRSALVFGDADHARGLQFLLRETVLLQVPEQAVAARRVADAERLQRLLVQPTALHIVAGTLTGRAPEQACVKGLRTFENCVQPTSLLLGFRFTSLGKLYPGHRREHAQSFAEL